jgi:uncharacterized membrane protein
VARPIAARARVDLFSTLRVWDTAENSGILIYVQLVERRVEILADRGIAARVPQAEWDASAARWKPASAGGQWRDGALRAVARAGALLAQHFPAGANNPNELPDQPLLL